MTGEKNKGASQERLWKLDDPDLATPTHDEMVVNLLNKEYCYKNLPFISPNEELFIFSEVPIFNTYNYLFIVGYWDIIISRENWASIFIEVKPRIDSFGRVLRQLNTYIKYPTENFGRPIPSRSPVIVFTYDHRFDEAFTSQNITIVHPKESV